MQEPTACPETECLRQYVRGLLEPEQKEQLSRHLDECSACLARIEASLAEIPIFDLRRNESVRSSNQEVTTSFSTPKPNPDSNSAKTPDETLSFRSPRDESVVEPKYNATEQKAPPTVIGYEILGELGQGGMGVVYLAKQMKANRMVALKMILASRHDSSEQRLRFQIEAEAIARLQHPNIVQLYEVGESEGFPFFSLELCEGGSLSRYLKATAIREGRLADLIETLARAMHYAHLQGVVHRDLKPGNVLLNKEGVPKVTDFGLARRLDTDSNISRSGAVMGTPAYMAPEQAAGKGREVGPLADVYALGAILYEMLAGRPPFRGETVFETIQQVLNAEPTPPSRFRSGVSRDLETISLKCLHKDPNRRYTSAEALAEDLRRFKAGEPITARPVSRTEQVIKWVRRRPAIAALSAAAGLLALVAAGVGIWALESTRAAYQVALADRDRANEERKQARQQKRRADFRTEEARQTLSQARGLLSDREWENGNLNSAEELLLQAPADLRGFEWGYRYRQHQGGLFKVQGHTSPLNCVAFSPDGLILATGSGDQTIRLWDARTGLPLRVLRGHTESVTSVAFSPDGTHLASGAVDQTARVWNARTGDPLFVLKGHASRVSTVAYHPNGKLLATGSWDATVRLWDARTGGFLSELQGHTANVTSLAFSPDGGRLITGSWDRTARIWETRNGNLLFQLKDHSDRVASVAFSPDGNRLATGSDDMTARIWDSQTGASQQVLKGHFEHLTSICFSPDGLRLASAAEDQTIRLWEVQTGVALLQLRGHTDRVAGVAFHPEGSRLATASWDQTARIWDVRPDAAPFDLQGHTGAVLATAFSPGGRYLATGSEDHTARIWDAWRGSLLVELRASRGRVTSVAFSPDGARLATGAEDKTIRLWDVRTGELLRELQGHDAEVTSVVFSPDGTCLASGSRDKTARLWEVVTGRTLFLLAGHMDQVTSVAFSPDGAKLATASYDHTAQIWSTYTGKPLFDLRGHTSWLTSIAFSPDGSYVATGSTDLTARLWDVRTGGSLRSLKGHSERVVSITFSPDGARLATASRDKTCRLWHVQTGDPLLDLKGHSSGVTSIAFSPDGSRLVTGSEDKSARIWNSRAQPPHLFLKGHSNRVLNVAFSPKGECLATASMDQTARLWNARTGASMAILKAHRNSITAIAFNPDATRLATGAEDWIACIWDTQSGSVLFELKGHADSVRNVAFSPDGKLLATGSRDQTARLWDAQTGAFILEFKGHTATLNRVQFAADGASLITGSINGEVRSWDVRTGQPQARKPLESPITPSLSPDGKRLAVIRDLSVAVIDVASPDNLEIAYRMRGTDLPLSWHASEAELARGKQNWFAIAFHLCRLSRFQRADLTGAGSAGAGLRLESLVRSGHPVKAAIDLLATLVDYFDAESQLESHNMPGIQELLQSGQWGAVPTKLMSQLAFVCDRFIRDTLLDARRRGALAAEQGKWDLACEQFARATAIPTANVLDFEALAYGHLAAERLDAFRQTCAQLTEAFPRHGDARKAFLISRLCSRTPHTNMAPDEFLASAEDAEAAIHNPATLHVLGATLYRLGRFEEAAKQLERAAARHGDEALVIDGFFLAMAYRRLGQFDDAKQELRDTLERSKAKPPLGWQEQVEFMTLRREAEALINAENTAAK